MKKKDTIIMLPTEDKTSLCKCIKKYNNNWLSLNNGQGDVGELIYNKNMMSVDGNCIINQHLYILSDDEIKEGDSVITLQDKSLAKVLATTDPKLNYQDLGSSFLNESQYGISGKKGYQNVPQIPQSLVEYYAKHQPKEIELALEHNDKTKPEIIRPWSSVFRYKIQNNEVVWVEPRVNVIGNENTGNPKQYTREEVEELCRSAHHAGVESEGHNGVGMMSADRWIKENL